jgi:hypothetical protein
MGKLKTIIEVATSFELIYDKESADFQAALDSYRATIDEDADEEEMLECVAYTLLKNGGAERMVEGVGYVQVKGQPVDAPFSGITVEDDDPDLETSPTETVEENA